MHESIFGKLSLGDIYITQAFDYYRDCYLKGKSAQDFVRENRVISTNLISNTDIGFCNRTLGLQIPDSRTLEGGAIRGHLKRCGLFTGNGGELFRECVVFPEKDQYGNYVSATGYLTGRIRPWQKAIIHWNKPEPDSFIAEGLKLVREVAYGKACH